MARGRGLTMLSDDAGAYLEAVRAKRIPGSEDDTDGGGKTPRQTKKEIHDEALERFKQIVEAESDQRAREREDLEFDRALPEDHWPPDVRRSRAGGVGPDGRVLPERPCLVVNRLAQPVQQIINEARQARLGILVKPKGDGGTTEEADVRQGLIRAIERDSNALAARLWALERAVKCGRGYYRILTEYSNDGDHDLDIKVARILNQGCVYVDPWAQAPDWSDMEWALITEDLSIAEYERRYGKGRVTSRSAEELTSLTDQAPGWVGDDHVRVAEYYYVEHHQRTLISLPEGGTVYADELEDAKPILPPGARVRKVDDRTVHWCVIDAEGVVDQEVWPGRWIPILVVTGREFVVDGDRTWKGVVSDAKDAQRMFNYFVSAQAESVGLAPKAPWIMWEGQDEGYEGMWDAANVKNFSRLLVKPTSFEGTLLPAPQRNVTEPAIQAITLAIREAENNIKATTGRFDPSLGAMSGERSGKAIAALQAQGQAGSSDFLDSLASVTMLHEGRILLDLLPTVYDRPGRVVRVLGETEDEERSVILGQPFVQGPNGPQPVSPPGMMPPGPQGAPPPGMLQRMRGMLPGGQPPPMQGLPQGPPPAPQPPPKLYDLSKGTYLVEVSVGQAKATAREANATVIEALLKAAPATAPIVMDLWAEQLEGPMARKLSDRLRRMNPQLAQAEQSEIPPAVQAQLQQMQQQLQEAQQIIAAEGHKAQAKAAAEGQLKQLDAQVAMKVAEIEAATKAKIAEVEAAAKAQLVELEARIAREAREDQQAHELGMQSAKLEAEIASRERIAAMQIEADKLKAQQAAQVTLTQATQKVGVDREKVAVSRVAGDRQHGLARETLADQQQARAEAREDAARAAEMEEGAGDSE